MKRSCEDEIKKLLNDSTSNKILVYGRRGVGKTYTTLKLAGEVFNNHIYINAESSASREFTDILKTLNDFRLAITQYYAISQELLPFIPVIIDEFTCNDVIYTHVIKLLEASDLQYRLILITSDCSFISTNTYSTVTAFRMAEIAFDEYLGITGHEWYKEVIEGHIRSEKAIPAIMHSEISDIFYEYLITGGDPRCINEQLNDETSPVSDDTNNSRYKELIADLVLGYNEDMSAKMIKIINAIPLNSDSVKFNYSTIRKGAVKAEFDEAINELRRKEIITVTDRIDNCASQYISLCDNAVYAYLIRNSRLYTKDVEDRLIEENYVRSVLAYNGISWSSWYSGTRSVVKILAHINGKEVPISVSTSSGKFKQYALAYAKENGLKKTINLGNNNISVNENLINIPIYSAFCLGYFIPQL